MISPFFSKPACSPRRPSYFNDKYNSRVYYWNFYGYSSRIKLKLLKPMQGDDSLNMNCT